jgi:murein DD-endopeptidase MepM/ murein hydrolase activator NlpD
MFKYRYIKLFLAAAIAVLIGGSQSLLADAIDWQGSMQQGGLLLGKVPVGYSVSYEGRVLKSTPEGQFLIGFGRQAPPLIKVLLSAPSGEQTLHELSIVQRQYKIQRVEGVPQNTVTPPAAELARIRSDSALVKRARKEVTDDLDFLTGFERPLEGPITGVYGSQRVYNGTPKSPHYGLDYAAPKGTLVLAPATGTVRMAHRDLFYSGGTLIVDHGHGLSSTFLHLSDILVSVGTQVKRGEAIAKVGSTGRATGPHLDWRMNWYKQRIDPALVLQALPAR